MSFHPAPNLRLPHPLEGYALIERLGRGGFGEVWKCEAPGGFLKAVKFVYGELDSAEESGRAAEQELKALNRVKDVRHPYILSLERYDVIDGQLMIVMELAQRNLWDRFRECRLKGLVGIPRDELMRYMGETAEALDLMNDQYQLQHLDIKPQNLFLMFDHVKVADFGLAKAFEGMEATVTGGVTPVYAAPETFGRQVTRFSDQYSLAIVYQELLTGARPFDGQNTKHLMLQHLRDEPNLSALPPHDRPIVARALSKEPGKRWPKCRDLVKHLLDAPLHVADAAALPLPAPGTPLPPPPSSGVNPPDRTRPLPSRGSGVTAPPARRSGVVHPAGRTIPASFGGTVTAVPPSSRALHGGSTTPLPTLVTPKMVAPRPPTVGSGVVPLGHTLNRNRVVETARMGELGIAPPERTGDGVLFPALVVGVGGTGLAVLRRLRRLVRDRFGKADAVPTLRFLYIDTDAEAAPAAAAGDDPLAPAEIVLARLDRPAHYLRHGGPPAVEGWLPPGLLYQLPKTVAPAAGRRAFGRLALCDHYKPIVQRVRQSVEAFMADAPLDKAAADTGLGLRSNRPRVYVAAGLGGGTGGGMALDLAYLLKHELRGVGYRNPEAFALLLVPPSDAAVPKPVLANAYAALAELSHFAAGQRWTARFDANDAPLVDTEPPFARTALVQLPKAGKPDEQARAVGAAARAAYLDLLTPVGRQTDFARSAAPTDPFAGPTAQPFGVYRLTWPRYELLAAIVQRFAAQLLRRWTAKEAAHLHEPIGWWLTDQWAKYGLDRAELTGRFAAALKDALRDTPEAVFAAAVGGFRARPPGGPKDDAQAAARVFDQLIKLVGKPDVDPDAARATGTLVAVVDKAAQQVAAEAEGHLAAVAVSFIEQPQYRLAGAEEALAQVTHRLKEAADDLRDLRTRRSRECVESYTRVFGLIGDLHGGGLQLVGRRASATGELCDHLAEYPRRRLEVLYLDAALGLFRRLRDGIPEYLREVAACRARLDELAAQVGGGPPADPAAEPGAYVLPVGCTELAAAADQFVAALPPDALIGFDQDVQATIARKFRGVVTVCMKRERGERFADVLVQAVREFLDARLDKSGPAEALAAYRGSGPDCLDVLEAAHDQAAPNLSVTAPPQVEATFLAAPDGPAADALRRLMQDAVPDTEFIPARLPDDILVYREFPRVPLGEVAQLNGPAEQAYRAAVGGDHPPHARSDVPWIAPIRPAPRN